MRQTMERYEAIAEDSEHNALRGPVSETGDDEVKLMDAITNTPGPGGSSVPELDRFSDEALRDVISRARALLADREEKQKKDALNEIRRIAKAHGLDVAIRKPAARRGRPPKVKARD